MPNLVIKTTSLRCDKPLLSCSSSRKTNDQLSTDEPSGQHSTTMTRQPQASLKLHSSPFFPQRDHCHATSALAMCNNARTSFNEKMSSYSVTDITSSLIERQLLSLDPRPIQKAPSSPLSFSFPHSSPLDRPSFSSSPLMSHYTPSMPSPSTPSPNMPFPSTHKNLNIHSLVDILRSRGSSDIRGSVVHSDPEHSCKPSRKAFTVVDRLGQEIRSWTWEILLDRANKIKNTILTKSDLNKQEPSKNGGARVALIFRKSEMLDFLAAFFGCQMAGMTAVPINMIEQFEEMIYILTHSRAELALTTEHNYRILSRDMAGRRLRGQTVKWPVGVTWWKTDTLTSTSVITGRDIEGDNSRRRKSKESCSTTSTTSTRNTDGSSSSATFSPQNTTMSSSTFSSSSIESDYSSFTDIAYIEYTKSPNGELKGVAISHQTILAQCHAISNSLELDPKRNLQSINHPKSPVSSEDILSLQSPLSPIPSDLFPPKQSPHESIDVVLSWLEPRQQVGLILGGLLGTYRGNHTVFVHSDITVATGLWEQCAHRYSATLALGDYQGIQELMQSSSLSPSSSSDPTKKISSGINLECIQGFLIDTVVIQPKLELNFSTNFLAPLGVPSAKHVVIPILSLPEHGGMVLSMKNYPSLPLTYDDAISDQQVFMFRQPLSSGTKSHYLLDREALKTNWIQVLAAGQDAIDRASEMGVVLVSSFGYALPQATLVIVSPETTALSLANAVGEIWVDSPSIPFGFWDLPKRSQSTFHALPLIIPSGLTEESKGATSIPKVCDPVPAGFLRTGLLAGLIEGQIVVFGHLEDRVHQAIPLLDIEATEYELHQGNNNIVPRTLVIESHFATDIVNTLMERIVGFTSCTVFECLLHDEYVPVICAETPRCHQRADVVKLADYIRQAMMDYHGLAVYCIAIASPDSLPRTLRHGKSQIHPFVCRKMLESGRLKLAYLWTSTEGILSSLPIGDDIDGGIWGSDAVMAREATLPVDTQTIQYSSCDYPTEVFDDRTNVDLSQFQSLADLLVWRTVVNSDEIAFQTLENQQQQDGSSLLLSLQSQDQQRSESSRSSSIRGSRENKPLTFRKFGAKVVRIAAYIEKKSGSRQGDKVILLFRTGSIEFIATLYAVWFLGLIAIPIPVPEPTRLSEDIVLLMGLLSELGYVSGVNGVYLLGDSFTEEIMRLKSTQTHMKAFIGARQDAVIPMILNVSKAPKIPKKNRRNLGRESGFLTPPKNALLESTPALIAVHYSTDKRRTFVKMTHASLMAQARAIKVQCQFQNENPIVSCAKSFIGLELILACAVGIYVGAPTILIPYADFEVNPQIYLEAVESFGARDVLMDCGMIRLTFGGQEPHVPIPLPSLLINPSTTPSPTLLNSTINLSSVQNFMVSSDSRPNLDTVKILEDNLCDLPRTAQSTVSMTSCVSSSDKRGSDLERIRLNGMFGHIVNPFITTRSSMDIEPVRLHISLDALRRGLIEITTEYDDPTGIWVEDSGIPVCGTTVAIVNPETSEICLSHEIGEIWVSSEANVLPYIGHTANPSNTTEVSDAMIELTKSRFHARIIPNAIEDDGSGVNGGERRQLRYQHQRHIGSKTFARTGEIGFLWNYATPDFNGGQPTSLLFVLGPIGETFEVQGLLHFPANIERTIETAHPDFVPNGSIVFQAEEAVVCVVTVHQAQSHELLGAGKLMSQALCVVHSIINQHGFIPDVVALVGEGVIAKTRFHEKQRGKMLSLFMSAKMPLLYIHYSKGINAMVDINVQEQGQQQQQQHQHYSTRDTPQLLTLTKPLIPTLAMSMTLKMNGNTSAYSSSSSCSSSSFSSSSKNKSSSSAASSTSRAVNSAKQIDDYQTPTTFKNYSSGNNNKTNNNNQPERRSTVRTIQSFVGSIFHGTKSTPIAA